MGFADLMTTMPAETGSCQVTMSSYNGEPSAALLDTESIIISFQWKFAKRHR